jgi:hypothetical protein
MTSYLPRRRCHDQLSASQLQLGPTTHPGGTSGKDDSSPRQLYSRHYPRRDRRLSLAVHIWSVFSSAGLQGPVLKMSFVLLVTFGEGVSGLRVRCGCSREWKEMVHGSARRHGPKIGSATANKGGMWTYVVCKRHLMRGDLPAELVAVAERKRYRKAGREVYTSEWTCCTLPATWNYCITRAVTSSPAA